jgi:hypothetical protein
MERFLKNAIVLLIAAFFAVMWGAYLRANLFAPSAGAGPGYSSLLEPGQDSRSMTWGIFLGEARVGRCTTVIRRQTPDLTSIETTTHFSRQVAKLVKLIASVQGDLVVVFRAEVTPLKGLQSFSLQVDALDVLLQGIVRGEELDVTGHAGERKIREKLRYERSGVVSSTASPVAVAGGLTEDSLGKPWTVSMVMPLTSELRTVEVTPVEQRTETISTDAGAEPEPVFLLSFRMGSDTWMAWVRADGEGLVQTLPPPLPVVMRREDLNSEAIGQLPVGVPAAPQEE